MHELGGTYLGMLMPWYVERGTEIPFYSTVEGAIRDQLDASYWRENLECPVKFNDGMQKLLNDYSGPITFVEIGSHSALKGSLRQILREHPEQKALYIPTLIRSTDASAAILTCLGRLFANGYNINFSLLNPGKNVAVDLPNYPWNHTSEHWIENRVSKAYRETRNAPHELLGSRCLESSEIEPR